MAASSSLSANRRRLGMMWHVAVMLFSVAAIDRASANGASQTLYFDLPSLSMTLNVEKTDNYLIPFQNRLRSTIDDHLEFFYEKKLLKSEVGVPKLVDIELESQLLWKELWVGPKEITEEVANHTYTETDFVKNYEVKGIFNCKMRLQIDPIITSSNEELPLYVPQTLMNLFFLEAFEGNYYWDLMQTFLTTPVLRDIINTEIEVMDVGFVHPHDEDGNLIFESDDDFEALGIDFGARQKQSTLANVGVVIAVLFLCVVVGIWYYLCIIMRGKKRYRRKKKKRRRDLRTQDDAASFKGSSRTRSTNSDDSDDESGDESDESYDSDEETFVGAWATTISRNLDAWASSVTSIPLRDVEKKRRKKRGAKVVQRPYFRPCQEHSSDLGCITEADNESWCSSVRSSKSGRSAKSSKSRASRYSRSRKRAVKSSIIHEEEDEAEDEEDQVQQSPLLTQRQLIKLMPSEDEVEDFRQNAFEI